MSAWTAVVIEEKLTGLLRLLLVPHSSVGGIHGSSVALPGLYDVDATRSKDDKLVG
jgi:hypothetical protein